MKALKTFCSTNILRRESFNVTTQASIHNTLRLLHIHPCQPSSQRKFLDNGKKVSTQVVKTDWKYSKGQTLSSFSSKKTIPSEKLTRPQSWLNNRQSWTIYIYLCLLSCTSSWSWTNNNFPWKSDLNNIYFRNLYHVIMTASIKNGRLWLLVRSIFKLQILTERLSLSWCRFLDALTTVRKSILRANG